jgi:dihydropteroate synthase
MNRRLSTKTTWTVGEHRYDGRRTLIMGVVNVTPDSFSDGGQFLEPTVAIEHGLQMIEQGADFLDVGGESTRPGAPPVSEEDELRRVVPIIEALAARTDVPISIDTSKAAVARRACEAGAAIINDVTGLSGDVDMGRVVAETQASVCLMHMLGTPRNMQQNVHYSDVVSEVADTLRERVCAAEDCGIERERIVVDPGIGFGKHLEHNLALIRACGKISEQLERPVLMGVSRKSFIGTLTGRPVDRREFGTAAALTACVLAGAMVVRVHDVAAAYDAVAIADALRADA